MVSTDVTLSPFSFARGEGGKQKTVPMGRKRSCSRTSSALALDMDAALVGDAEGTADIDEEEEGEVGRMEKMSVKF